MRLPGLRELDRMVVPVAGRRLRDFVDHADAAGCRAGRAARQVRRDAVLGLRSWAERTDRRYATSGPLGLAREVPQVALLLVAVVFVSGAFAAVWLAEPEQSSGAGQGNSPLPQASLGVPPGSDVEAHLAQARQLLEDLAQRRPDDRHVALVSLGRYLTVAELAALVEGGAPQRVYLQAPGVDGAQIVEVPLAGSGADAVLPVLCAATAGRHTSDAQELRSLTATIEGTTPEEQLQRADFETEAARAEAEAEAYGGVCATAFAVVVEAPTGELRALLDREQVRGVEVAPAGASVLDLAVTPLPPEVSGVLPTGTER